MIGLIVFGAISFSRMGVSQLPDVDFPVLTVVVNWQGAAPETMELAVADVVESAVMTVEGIRSVTSSCQEGRSTTSIEFDLTRDINVALQEVQTKLAQAQRMLPNDIDPPIVTKSNPEDQPIMFAALTGGTLRDKIIFIRDYLKDWVTTVSGVGDVFLGGYVDPNMRIWLNTDKMHKKEIAVSDVLTAISAGHTLTPSGYMDNGPREVNVRVLAEAKNPKEFENLPISQRSGAVVWKNIKVGEVARVEEGLADLRRMSRKDGISAVGLGVIKQRGSNAVAVGDGVKKKVAALRAMLPKGMDISVVNDSTKFIKDAVNELSLTLILAAILTSLVCWLFLGSWSSAFNVILAIPTSLIGSFIILNFCGFTINTFTMLALSLSVGIVVDDAIMVLENIARHREEGMGRIQAAVVGAREITSAATSASLAILAIFIPVVFMRGIIGKFFFQFGITMSVAVILSLIEALTLAPMRCSQFLEVGHTSSIGKMMDRLMTWLIERYRQLLTKVTKRPLIVLLAALAVFGSSIFLLRGVNKEFVPPQDMSRFLVNIQTPMGSSMEFTDAVFKKAEAILKGRPELDTYFVSVGGFQGGIVSTGTMFINLKDPKKRTVTAPFTHRPSQQEFASWYRGEITKIEGITRATVLDLSQAGFAASRGYPVSFSLQGPDLEKLADYSAQIMEKMKASGLMTDVDTDYRPGMPEVRVVPDREAAATFSISISSIADTISAMVGSLRIGRYTDYSGHRDDIRVKLEDSFNRTPQDLSNIWMRNLHGEMVPLAKLVKLEEKPSLLTITRYNRERAISIFANVLPGKSQADAMAFVDKAAASVLPQNYHTVLSGNSQAMKESMQSLILALVLGIFVAYMVLGSQFNSFIHPVTVLLALPFSVTGAFLALRLTGISLNIYSMIGILLLMGIVKKNSILLVDFTNAKRATGLAVREALLAACPLRLRPILMTSVATVAGAIPAAFSLGARSETMRSMAVVVIGGVIMSTLLTLLVVPCAYLIFQRFELKKHDEEMKLAFAASETTLPH